MEGSVSQSASTVRQLPACLLSGFQDASDMQRTASSSTNLSLPSSPRSGALPSPPDSPAGSVSSLPSVTSSFFFSSAAASPGRVLRPLDHHDHDHDNHSDASHESAARNATRGLIIPSLTLPPALRRSTPYGQTLGELRLLVLGRQGGGKSFLTSLLLEDNEEVVEVGTWEDPIGEDGEGEAEMALLGMAGAKVLRASTSWIQHSDQHGLDKFEPARNVEIVEFPGYDGVTDGANLVRCLKDIIRGPFQTLAGLLCPNTQPSVLLANLLSSSACPLFTALILLVPSSPTPLERLIIDSLAGDIPIIVLAAESSPSLARAKLSGFRPSNAVALRNGLFHSPETIGRLRMEAAERFMRWREVERAVDRIVHQKSDEAEHSAPRYRSQTGWDKEKWEREWMVNLSRDVSVALQHRKHQQPRHRSPLSISYKDEDADNEISPSTTPSSQSEVFETSPSHLLTHSQPLDPLHLPSLLLFTVSLLGPLKARVLDCIKVVAQETDAASRHRRGRLLVVGGLVTAGFAVGVGVGAACAGLK